MVRNSLELIPSTSRSKIRGAHQTSPELNINILLLAQLHLLSITMISLYTIS